MKNKLNSRETLIYLAGCLDCDGYLTIVQSTYRLSRGKASHPEYYEAMGLKQTNPIVVNLLQDTFGGCIFAEQPSASGGKLLYAWRATHKIAAVATPKLLPYLRVKHRQAELMMLLRSSIDRAKARVVPNRALPPEENKLRSELVTQIRALNDIRTKRPKLL